MSLITWYKVKVDEADAGSSLLGSVAAMLTGGLPLTVSSDVFSGQYILDADIKLNMVSGAIASDFDVTLTNLPPDVADTLKGKHHDAVAGGKPLEVQVFLGYLEDLPQFTARDPVMTGVLQSLRISVSDTGMLVAKLHGQEKTGYSLRTQPAAKDLASQSTADDFVQAVAGEASVQSVKGKIEGVSVKDLTVKADNALDVIGQLARSKKPPAAVVVRDNTIYLGDEVGKESGPDLDSDVNIARMDEEEYFEELRGDQKPTDTSQPKGKARTARKLTVLGDAGLKVGQQVTVKSPSDAGTKWVINHVEHRLSPREGYVCEVSLVSADPGEAVSVSSGAQGLVDRFQDLTEGALNNRPAVDVGQVVSYEPGSRQKHLTTLYYGQSPAADVVSPSVATTVDNTTQLHSKPLMSPFAFHKCGLVVPVYPSMRALLLHNRGLVNDAAVAGFLWSENPTFDRPQNEAGDYWLCLPTELGSDGLPTGKGVNDLTDAAGKRVIQAKGLHIMVGTDLLPDVGSRPTVDGDLENQVVIEHKSGTKVTIDANGKVLISAPNQEITLSTGDLVSLKLTSSSVEVTNGSVSLKLNGQAVEVS